MSMTRRDYRWLATDGKWYHQLGDFEHAHEDDECTIYGPFNSEDDIDRHLSDHFPSTSMSETDDKGTQPPPEEPTKPRRTNQNQGMYFR